MRYEIIRSLVTKKECDELNQWADIAVKNNWLGAGIQEKGVPYPKELRVTSRFYGHRFEHPHLALDIFSRIRKALDLPNAPLVTGHGRDGIVVNYTMNGGTVYEHTDGKTGSLATLRCNLLSRKSKEGGELFINNIEHPMEECAIHCYLVSENPHRVEEVRGDIPRVLWMFGFAVPVEDWELGKIKVQQ
jgi:hypothetical protein